MSIRFLKIASQKVFCYKESVKFVIKLGTRDIYSSSKYVKVMISYELILITIIDLRIKHHSLSIEVVF